ncbi:MAG: hypothetical protein CMP40_00790 [Rickettsiales bacterium]|nr:hypothetical protein [Rickettsiales bacterium]
MKKLFILFLFFPFFSFAKIEIKSVVVNGIGSTEQLAIESGLVEAVSQINGAKIAAEIKTSLSQTTTEEGSEVTKSFDKNVSKLTNGFVRSYKILSSNKDKNLYNVKLSVEISKFKKSVQTKRLRLAVVPFKASNTLKVNDTVKKFEGSITSQIENYLTQTRRFSLVDRSFLEEQTNELNFIADGAKTSMSNDEIAKLGNRIGTDYLIVGRVEKANSFITEKKSKVSDTVKKSLISNAVLTLRIIDVATTQIKFSDTYEKSMSSSIEKVAADLASSIGDEIINAIYPIRIVNASLTQVTLGQGGKTMATGDLFKVYQLGKRIKDVYTGESLGREEIEVATIQIKTIKPKTSEAQILESIIELSDAIKDKDAFIVRPFKKAKAIKAKAIKAKSQSVEKTQLIKKLKKESEEEW